MQQITDIIKPIQLLAGSHAETAQTGQGCFMNVIAYLNGEPQITDQSPCVCAVVRPIAIWLNDFATDTERQQLLPFIHRAMGSKTDNRAELSRRAWLAVGFANKMKDIAADAAYAAAADAAADAHTAHAAAADDAAADADAAHAAAYAAAYAAAALPRPAAAAHAAAAYAAHAAAYAAAAAHAADIRQKILAAGLEFLDAALPAAGTPAQELIARAQSLVDTFNLTHA